MTRSRNGRARLPGLGLGTAAVTVFAAVAVAPATAGAAPAGGTILHAGVADAIPGNYIVVLEGDPAMSTQADVTTTAESLAASYGGDVGYVYSAALRGFSAEMSADEARKLAADPSVAYVEQDSMAHVVGTQPNPPSWGLDRIDQRDLPLDNSYTFPNEGTGVNVYVIDTGIRVTHNEFGARASVGVDLVNDGQGPDCQGHGTHVSGTAGGSSFGVAKDVDLFAVRVLDCNGGSPFSRVIEGIDWVTNNGVQPAAVNMSLGGGANNATDQAVRESIQAGFTYTIAAGNNGGNACNTTPARVTEAITLAASDINDNEPNFSNTGQCVDLYAPGVAIVSAFNRSDNDSASLSGTSMSAPHAAGAAALILADNPGASPAQVRDTMVNSATQGAINNPGANTPNLLLFVGDGTDPGPDPDPGAPVASFSTSCSFGASGCTFDASGSTGSISGFGWSFGDGATGSGAVVSHAYPGGVSDTYTVTLTVSDDSGRTDSASAAVQCFGFGGSAFCFPNG